MEKSKVYFTNFRARPGYNLLQKLEKLIKKAGIENIDFENKYTAIKIHFGEPGNLAYLRPNYAKVVADVVKKIGGKPFLTDCNTLYVGGRKNALDHIDSAYLNGFTPFSTGSHVIIADGLKGTDEENAGGRPAERYNTEVGLEQLSDKRTGSESRQTGRAGRNSGCSSGSWDPPCKESI